MNQEVFSFKSPERITSNFSIVSFIADKVRWLNNEGYVVVSYADLGTTHVFIVERQDTEGEI